MKKLLCKYTRLTDVIADVPGLAFIEYYKESIKPLEYDLCVSVGESYEILGLVMRSGTPWLYVFRHDEDYEIDILPAVLFDSGWIKLPPHWCMRINPSSTEEMEFLPEQLISVDHWFERYIDEEPEVVELVESLCLKNVEGPNLNTQVEPLKEHDWWKEYDEEGNISSQKEEK